MSYVFCRKFTIIHSEFCQLMMILYHICNIETIRKAYLILIFFLFSPYLVAIIFIGDLVLKTRRIFNNFLTKIRQKRRLFQFIIQLPAFSVYYTTSGFPSLDHFHHISLAPDPHINAVSKHLCADQIAFWSLCDNLCCWQSI